MKRAFGSVVLAGATMGAIVTGASPAAAQGELLNLSNLVDLSDLLTVSPSVLTSCYQLGQGEDNKFWGTQTITCNQSATATQQLPPPPSAGLTGFEVVEATATIDPNLVSVTVDAICPAGKVATGGGYFTTFISDNGVPFVPFLVGPVAGDPTRWRAIYDAKDNFFTGGVWATCYDAAS